MCDRAIASRADPCNMALRTADSPPGPVMSRELAAVPNFQTCPEHYTASSRVAFNDTYQTNNITHQLRMLDAFVA